MFLFIFFFLILADAYHILFRREISDINEIGSDKEYVDRYQLVQTNDTTLNQQAYEQHSARVRTSTDSPEVGDLTIQNNPTVYVTAQHPNSTPNEDPNGLRYAAAHEVRYENYDYPHAQHHQAIHHNAHGASNGDVIKFELIRNQHSMHASKMHASIEEAHQQPPPQTESKIQYTNLDVSPQGYYVTDGYQATGSGLAYLGTMSNKDYSIYQGSPSSVLYKGTESFFCFLFCSRF